MYSDVTMATLIYTILQHTCSTPQLTQKKSSDLCSEHMKLGSHSRTIVVHVAAGLPCYKVKLLVTGSMTLPIPSRSGSQQSLEIYAGEVGQTCANLQAPSDSVSLEDVV